MSLRSKVTLILVSVLVIYGALNYLIVNRVMFQAFSELEVKAATDNLVRVEKLLASDLDHIRTLVADWAQWDDTHTFVQDRNQAYMDSNLTDDVPGYLELNLLLYFNTAKELVWGRIVDLESEEVIPLEVVFPDGIETHYDLLQHDALDSEIKGVINTAQGPMLIASLPILTSEVTGPIAGTILMGRFVDAGKVSSLHERALVELDLLRTDSATNNTAYQRLQANSDDIDQDATAERLRLTRLMSDIKQQPVLLLQVDTPREITQLGQETIVLGMLFLIVAGALVMVVIWLLLQGLILGPLSKLNSHITAISASGDLSRKLEFQRRDEIGVLATEFGAMQTRLQQANSEVLSQSFKAGMAENAAGVLHNIRNALTPLASRLGRVTDKLQQPASTHLDVALTELASPDTVAERRQKLTDYVRMVVSNEGQRDTTLLDELGQAISHIGHIEDIVADQEKYARSEPVLENIELNEAIAEAMALLPEVSERPAALRIDPSVSDFGALTTHRVAIVQVLQNLMLNAQEAVAKITAVTDEIGEVAISAARELADGKPMLHLRIVDNGAGIESDKLEEIFQRGFTSKQKGKGGLGLHWCANTVASLGGKLTAHSDGPDRGAQIHLWLPAN